MFFTISVIIDCRFLGFRDEEEARLKTDPKLTLGDVTTINLTIMEGGVQVGIVSCHHLVFDDHYHQSHHHGGRRSGIIIAGGLKSASPLTPQSDWGAIAPPC